VLGGRGAERRVVELAGVSGLDDSGDYALISTQPESPQP